VLGYDIMNDFEQIAEYLTTLYRGVPIGHSEALDILVRKQYYILPENRFYLISDIDEVLCEFSIDSEHNDYNTVSRVELIPTANDRFKINFIVE
jgi:hypothetical protein